MCAVWHSTKHAWLKEIQLAEAKREPSKLLPLPLLKGVKSFVGLAPVVVKTIL